MNIAAWVTLSARMMLLKSLGSKKNDPKLLITHRFKVDRIFDAYKTFGPTANTTALKVVIIGA